MTPCLCATTRRASRLLTQLYENELRPYGLNPSQFELLSTIAVMDEASQTALARQLSADQTTLSRNLKVLVRDGLLNTRIDRADKRQVAYSLTAQGKDAWKRAGVGWNRAQRGMERALGGDWDKTWTALTKLVRAAGA